ncbi:hypothetical protein AB0L65_16560 [Nonomuraea sp. NPDC052116]|uniref:hypothetical protein n=1 Tax=Nonomuraea sp. NPDC052116 TaxID=3155665 RepID=UPI00341FCC70
MSGVTTTWRCSLCDVYNATADTSCRCCDAVRRTATEPPRALFFAPPPPPVMPPPPLPPPMPPPAYRSSSTSSFAGCMIAILTVAFLCTCVLLLVMLAGFRARVPASAARSDPPIITTSADQAVACPDRVALLIPDGGADLVAAYDAGDKHIVICRTATGELYYYGQYIGRDDTGLLMPAQETSAGLLARNGSYLYEIQGDEVVVSVDGREILREFLVATSPRFP